MKDKRDYQYQVYSDKMVLKIVREAGLHEQWSLDGRGWISCPGQTHIQSNGFTINFVTGEDE
jgi:hypothetical protein